MHVAPLGINHDGHARSDAVAPKPFTIGYLARIAPEKGLHTLCEAYRRLRSRPELPPSRLVAAGYLGPEHKSYLADIHNRMDDWGLSSHFRYAGELDRRGKLEFLRSLDVLSVPGSYPDPKGMSLLEAMASGVPVVQPRCGAFTEVVDTTGGGILVEPDNPDSLADGILELWRDPERRRELGARGYDGVRAHYSTARMTEKVLEVYRTLLDLKGSGELRCSKSGNSQKNM